MISIDKRIQFEEQILMKREVANIKTGMLQMIEHARLGGIHPMMAQGQMHQMAQRVLMIRQRCQHIWETEYTSHDDCVFTEVKICLICEAHQDS